MKSPLRWILLGVLLLLAVLAGVASFFGFKGSRPVKTVAAERGPVTAVLSLTGKIVAVREVVLSAAAPGTVSVVHVKEGEKVRSGHALISLDVREKQALESKSEANLRQAEEELAQAQRVLEVARNLYRIGGENRQAVDDAESRAKIAEAKVRAAREDLHLARVGLQNTVVRAPFAGLISAVTAEVGQWAAPGNGVVTLADPNAREIDAKADAGDGSVIKVGQQAIVTSDAFPGREWRERVLRLAPAVEKSDAANTFSVRLSLGANAPPLRLGQQVDLRIQLASKADALRVPIAALVPRADGVAVVVLRGDRAHFAPVQTGIEDLNYMEIVAGLQAGDRVILPESRAFAEGERVKASDGPR